MIDDLEDYITIGKILRPHGLKGEIKVLLLTDYPERFDTGRTVRLKKKAQRNFKSSLPEWKESLFTSGWKELIRERIRRN